MLSVLQVLQVKVPIQHHVVIFWLEEAFHLRCISLYNRGQQVILGIFQSRRGGDETRRVSLMQKL